LFCRQLKAKCDALEKHLFECESEKNTNKKQLADAMVFLRETVSEQELLLRRAAAEGRNDPSTAVLSASISARVKALTEHLQVPIHLHGILAPSLLNKVSSFFSIQPVHFPQFFHQENITPSKIVCKTIISYFINCCGDEKLCLYRYKKSNIFSVLLVICVLLI